MNIEQKGKEQKAAIRWKKRIAVCDMCGKEYWKCATNQKYCGASSLKTGCSWINAQNLRDKSTERKKSENPESFRERMKGNVTRWRASEENRIKERARSLAYYHKNKSLKD